MENIDEECTQYSVDVDHLMNENQIREEVQHAILLTNHFGSCQQDQNVNQNTTACATSTQRKEGIHEAAVQTESPYFHQSEGFGSLDVHFNPSQDEEVLNSLNVSVSAVITPELPTVTSIRKDKYQLLVDKNYEKKIQENTHLENLAVEDAEVFIPIKRRKRKTPAAQDVEKTTSQSIQVQENLLQLEEQTQSENIELRKIEENTNNLNQNTTVEKQTATEHENINLEGIETCEEHLKKEISGKSLIIIKYNEKVGSGLMEVHLKLNKGDSIEVVSLTEQEQEQVSITQQNNTNIENQLNQSEINKLDGMVEESINNNPEINNLREQDCNQINKNVSVDEFEFRRIKMKCLNCKDLCEVEFKKRIGKSKHKIVCSCNWNNLIKFNKDNELDSILLQRTN